MEPLLAKRVGNGYDRTPNDNEQYTACMTLSVTLVTA
jgi:hypothetical protein